MSAAPFTRRVPKRFKKTITFTGAADLGAVGTVAVATITGSVLFTHLGVRCNTNLAGATATLEMGVSGNTAGLIAQTAATDIDDGDFWQDASPEVGISPAIVDQLVEGNIILTVGTADITAGVLEIVGYWLPVSDDGNVA